MITFSQFLREQAAAGFDVAYSIAKKAHASQKDSSGAPYIKHVDSVIKGVSRHGEDVRMVAALHDVLEDTDVTVADLKAAGIPQKVIDAVIAITWRPSQPLDDYYKQVRANPLARIVKLADVANNSDEKRLKLVPEPRQSYLRNKYAKAMSVLECFIFDEEEILPHTSTIIEKERSSLTIQPWFGIADNLKILQNLDDKKKAEELAKELYGKVLEFLVDSKKEYVRVLERSANNQTDKVLIDVKSVTSFIDKIVYRGKNPARITDVLRGAILAADEEGVKRIINNLKKYSRIAEYEYKDFGGDKKYGYYGSHHLLVDVKGVLAEIQVMTKKLWTYKGEAHQIYDNLRSVKGTAMSDAEIKKMLFKSKQLFRIGNSFSA